MSIGEHERLNGTGIVAAGMWWPLLILASGVAVIVVTITQAGTLIRPLIAFWFLLVCPGMAFVPLLSIRDRLIQCGLAVALSIGLDGVVSETMLYMKAWSYEGALAVLIIICLIGTVLQIWTRLREPRGEEFRSQGPESEAISEAVENRAVQ